MGTNPKSAAESELERFESSLTSGPVPRELRECGSVLRGVASRADRTTSAMIFALVGILNAMASFCERSESCGCWYVDERRLEITGHIATCRAAHRTEVG